MRWLFLFAAAAGFTFSVVAQGTIVFHNRGLSPSTPDGFAYNAGIGGYGEFAYAQLCLLTGEPGSSVYTPLSPLQSFRAYPNNSYFKEPVLVEVPGQPSGTTGVRFVVRVWDGNSDWDKGVMRAESEMITVRQPLGGTNPISGIIFPPPDLGGPDGLQSFVILVPYVHLYSIGTDGTNAHFQVSVSSAYQLQTSLNLTNWIPILTNSPEIAHFSLPLTNGAAFFPLRNNAVFGPLNK